MTIGKYEPTRKRWVHEGLKKIDSMNYNALLLVLKNKLMLHA